MAKGNVCRLFMCGGSAGGAGGWQIPVQNLELKPKLQHHGLGATQNVYPPTLVLHHENCGFNTMTNPCLAPRPTLVSHHDRSYFHNMAHPSPASWPTLVSQVGAQARSPSVRCRSPFGRRLRPTFTTRSQSTCLNRCGERPVWKCVWGTFCLNGCGERRAL